jgi:regulator of nonsense transcripts 1
MAARRSAPLSQDQIFPSQPTQASQLSHASQSSQPIVEISADEDRYDASASNILSQYRYRIDDEDEEENHVLPEHACKYCGIFNPQSVVKCGVCEKWFCNGRGSSSGSHIIQHLVRARHREVSLHKDSVLGDATVECYNCGIDVI